MIERIISGGQTGVDRAALEVAIELSIPHGGWIPRSRRAEDGRIPDRFEGLLETESTDYRVRTARNVRESDATLIISRGPLEGGSLLTSKVAQREGKLHLHLDLDGTTTAEAAGRLRGFIASEGIAVLNVAGPRASKDAEIGALAAAVLRLAFTGGSL